ncbi:MAG: glycosyltransferase family 2 protein [Xanthomonadales bacterium]|jgi:GT2 family glycosyltransferase|nr:glycosyltransferase family 2 protein [Xanthomonadales bacterium]
MRTDPRFRPGYLDEAGIARAIVDVQIVTWWTTPAQLERLLAGLQAYRHPKQLQVHLWDNSVSTDAHRQQADTLAPAAPRFAALNLHASPRNLGFGKGHNALLAHGTAEWILLLNPDAALDSCSLEQALSVALNDPAAGAVEFRQRPYEHPKDYHPITLETSWVSGAAVLLRRSALVAIGGFDPRLFLYGEDVDLSWRLRAAGFRLRYVPWATVLHETYASPGQIKPQQTLGSTFANLCLRRRYGNAADVRVGLKLLLSEVFRPESFAGRRRGLLFNLARFIKHERHFARTRVAPTTDFAPHFAAWDYEHRRKGAFWPAVPAERLRDGPRVSILIRTHRRPAFLREALLSVARQTYRNIEAVVVEDGEPTAREMVEREFADVLPVRYHATGTPVGRSRAGNLALSMSTGEWFNFLDDDDLLYADHIETLLGHVLGSEWAGAYGVGWEVPTEVQSLEPLRYRESAPLTRYQMPFNHLTLWTHNYIPIQCALFHRRLYDVHGGFETDMDQLEDWNLWTRYTLADCFALVDKTTSLYRVPLHPEQSAARQAQLDEAYRHALARQNAMRVQLSPAVLRAALPQSTLIPSPLPPKTLRRQILERLPVVRRLLHWRDHWRGF